MLKLVESSVAKRLLNNWEESRQHFYYVIPKSWLSYHRSESIALSNDRRTMMEELAEAVGSPTITHSQRRLREFCLQWPGYV